MEEKTRFRVVYSLDGSQSVHLSSAETEEAAKKELRNWVKATFPWSLKLKILYVTPFKGDN